MDDGQMYLPLLGLDISKIREVNTDKPKHFTTPAQLCYLFFLYHKAKTINTTELAKELDLNIMTASRA